MSTIVAFKTVSPVWLGDIVDELGQVKAQIANLEKREAELRQAIIDSGESEAEGDLFRATVSETITTKIDYKAVCEKLGPSTQLLTAHTSHSDRVTVKVVSR